MLPNYAPQGVDPVKYRMAMAMLERSFSNSQSKQRLTVDNNAIPLGCCDFFSPCNDELMSLHYSGGLPLLDWMGFNVSEVCNREVEFIDYVRPEQSEGSPTPGYLATACEEPNGIEYGASKITYEGFGRYGRKSPTRDIMEPKKRCVTDPIWRLDGVPVEDENEWDMKFAMDQIIADISTHIITGDDAVTGQFRGFEGWVATTYASAMLNSIVIDWNSNPLAGGAGITWNGAATPLGLNMVDFLRSIFRRFKTRKAWAAVLKTQPINTGDMILALPNDLIACLLDHFTCWSVCDGSQYNEVALQSYEARQFRDVLNGGPYGDGQITLDGQLIPLIGYDYGLIKGASLYDFYFLTGSLGSQRIWYGDHVDASIAAQKYDDHGYWSTDGGRVLAKAVLENECRELKAWIHPRTFCKAPFMQARFQNVTCTLPEGTISPDPESGYYPLEVFTPAECAEEEQA